MWFCGCGDLTKLLPSLIGDVLLIICISRSGGIPPFLFVLKKTFIIRWMALEKFILCNNFFFIFCFLLLFRYVLMIEHRLYMTSLAKISCTEGGLSMNNKNNLEHTTYRCKYHIVLLSKYRRMVIYSKLRKDIDIANTD